jgi:hypothetical protein
MPKKLAAGYVSLNWLSAKNGLSAENWGCQPKRMVWPKNGCGSK